MFKMISKVLFGETSTATENFQDLRTNELFALVPLALLVLAMGIFPNYFIKKIEPTAQFYLVEKEALTK